MNLFTAETGNGWASAVGPVRSRRGTKRAPTPLLILEDRRMTLATADGVVSGPSPLSVPHGNRIVLKLEHLHRYNPTGSLYDRLYPFLLEHYSRAGVIVPGRTPLIECSVGNAGAAFAWACREAGFSDYRLILPADIYAPRIEIAKSLGAQVLHSPPDVGPWGYVQMIQELAFRRVNDGPPHESRLFPISKIRNVPEQPYARFVDEALGAMRAAGVPRIDHFVFGVGAGNTISMVGKNLKRRAGRTVVHCAEFAERAFTALLRDGRRPAIGGTWADPAYIAGTIHGVPLEKLHLDLSVIDTVCAYAHDVRDGALGVLNDVLGLEAGRSSALVWAGVWDLAQRVQGQTIFSIIFDGLAKYSDTASPCTDMTLEPLRGLVPVHVSECQVQDSMAGRDLAAERPGLRMIAEQVQSRWRTLSGQVHASMPIAVPA